MIYLLSTARLTLSDTHEMDRLIAPGQTEPCRAKLIAP